jgi:hypothetical protein
MVIFYLLMGAAILVIPPFAGVQFIINGLKQKRRWLSVLGLVTLLFWLTLLMLAYMAANIY